MRITDKYVFFWGGIFSNFHPISSIEESPKFLTSEHYFMYNKAIIFKDQEIADMVLKVKKPSEAKALGREVKNYNNEEWSKVRFKIMKEALEYKFLLDDEFKNELKITKGKILVEASPYDNIWGVGLRENDKLIDNECNWRGLNLLGKALTELRMEKYGE